MRIDWEAVFGAITGSSIVAYFGSPPNAQKASRAVRACKIEGEAILADLVCKGKRGENEGQ
jgi:hypothetical protein